MTSAIAEKGGALTTLLDDGSVVRYLQGATTKLFQVPTDLGTASAHATVDALAITPEGEYAVLRFTAGSEAPSSDYPVLAYRPDEAPEALAPFTSVVPETDAACATAAGYRAIVLSNRSWLKVERGPAGSDDDWGMVALVRWSKERVCLEALEIADSSFAVGDETLLTRISASFGAKPSASRQGFAPGVELLQPLSCALERAR